MHRETKAQKAPGGPSVTQRLGAIAALVLTPVVGIALARIAWEQSHALLGNAPEFSAFGPVTLTLGQVLSPLAATAGALVAAHLTWTTAVMVLTPRTSRVRATVAALTPATWRRLVAVATAGTLSVGLAFPATATSIDHTSLDSTDAGWIAAPAEATPAADVAVAAATTDDAMPLAQPTSASALSPETEVAKATEVRVAPGDTLWDITAAQLGLAASDHSAIAAEWPKLYEENRDKIGDDPGLIVPDQRLALPQEWTA